MPRVIGFAPGPRFAEVRGYSGLSQIDLGEKTGMGQSAISRFERKLRIIKQRNASKLAKVLGFASLEEAVEQKVLAMKYEGTKGRSNGRGSRSGTR